MPQTGSWLIISLIERIGYPQFPRHSRGEVIDQQSGPPSSVQETSRIITSDKECKNPSKLRLSSQGDATEC